LLGIATFVLAAYVAVGMVDGSDRRFERGVAPLEATIMQEVAGAVALVSLALVAWRLRRFARGDGVVATIGLFLLSIVLCLVWVFAYGAQHAS
jgi:cbb3-type cytochrome oxidase subunit 3